MSSIIDYTNEQNLNHIIANDLIDRAQYLMSIRQEMEYELNELDARLDNIALEMQKMGIDLSLRP